MLPGGTPPLTCQKPHISSQQTAGRDSCLEVAILHLRLRNGSQMVGYSGNSKNVGLVPVPRKGSAATNMLHSDQIMLQTTSRHSEPKI